MSVPHNRSHQGYVTNWIESVKKILFLATARTDGKRGLKRQTQKLKRKWEKAVAQSVETYWSGWGWGRCAVVYISSEKFGFTSGSMCAESPWESEREEHQWWWGITVVRKEEWKIHKHLLCFCRESLDALHFSLNSYISWSILAGKKRPTSWKIQILICYFLYNFNNTADRK